MLPLFIIYFIANHIFVHIYGHISVGMLINYNKITDTYINIHICEYNKQTNKLHLD